MCKHCGIFYRRKVDPIAVNVVGNESGVVIQVPMDKTSYIKKATNTDKDELKVLLDIYRKEFVQNIPVLDVIYANLGKLDDYNRTWLGMCYIQCRLFIDQGCSGSEFSYYIESVMLEGAPHTRVLVKKASL